MQTHYCIINISYCQLLSHIHFRLSIPEHVITNPGISGERARRITGSRIDPGILLNDITTTVITTDKEGHEWTSILDTGAEKWKKGASNMLLSARSHDLSRLQLPLIY